MHNLSQDSGNHSDGESGHSSMGSSNDSGTGVNGGAGGGSGGGGVSRKRRKQTHVPEQNKDDRYWARRLKNNEAAKRSRDMRIKREKVVFEENSRLEKLNQDLQTDMERMATENKELHLKLDIIMEENMRIKSVLLGYQSQRRSSVEVSSGGGHSSSDEDNNHASPPHQQLHHLSNSNRGGGRRESSEVRPFPFPN